MDMKLSQIKLTFTQKNINKSSKNNLKKADNYYYLLLILNKHAKLEKLYKKKYHNK